MYIPVEDPDGRLKAQILQFCRDIADSGRISAVCIVGDYALGLRDAKEVLQILVVIRNFQPRLISRVGDLDGRNIIVLAVDQWVFERDVERGFLGEALAQRMVFPYIPLINKDYLRLQEIKLKKRLVLELLETLVLDYPELSYSFHMKPEYFLYETMMSRARLFPPMIHTVSSFLQEDVKNRNVESVMHGYLEALEELEKENAITISGGWVKIDKKFAEKVERRKTHFVNLFRTTQRTLFNSLLGTFSKTLDFLMEKSGSLLKYQRRWSKDSEVIHRLEDPLKYLYVPTGRGFVPLSDRMDIESFARRIVPAGQEAEIEVEEIGGVLNDVYLIKVSAEDNDKKIVAKRFKDWSSFKWFPLNLWTLGTKTFAVLPRSRLERECAMNQLLYSKGFDVPTILHVSHSERLIFRQYIEGKKLNKIIKRISKPNIDENLEDILPMIGRVGEIFAEVHDTGVALGDTKPENIMIGEKKGEVFLLDMEQASRNGDKVWDIAEFVYYTGHYIPPLVRTHRAELLTKAFIRGYLQAGGDVKLVKEAGDPKYTKVFSIFTLPHILLTISNVCKEADKLKK